MVALDRLGFIVQHTLSLKGPVRVATTANITLSGTQTIDGVAVVSDDRVLVKNQTSAQENAIYVVKASTWELAEDFDQRGHVVKGTRVFVTEGTTNASTEWVVTTSGQPVPARSEIGFSQYVPGTSAAALLALLLTVDGAGSLLDADLLDGKSSAVFATGAIEFIIDGGGVAITTGIKGDIEIPFACTIDQVTMLADQSGSIVVDIWKDTYASYPPTVADTITASAKPTISTATKSQDTTLTGWTTSIAAGDILRFNVDSVTSIQRVTLSLRVTKT